MKAENLIDLLDHQLDQSGNRPVRLWVTPEMRDSVLKSRNIKKNRTAFPALDPLFKTYRGYPVCVVGEDHAS